MIGDGKWSGGPAPEWKPPLRVYLIEWKDNVDWMDHSTVVCARDRRDAKNLFLDAWEHRVHEHCIVACLSRTSRGIIHES